MALFDLDFYRSPYQFKQKEKDQLLTRQLQMLTDYHRKHCALYERMVSACGFFEGKKAEHYRELPFLPVGLFKQLHLSSLDEEENAKTVTSSGTSGAKTSQIVLDGETRTLQQQALAAIGGDFLGQERLPMLVIDCPATVKKRNFFSARTSGILGFSLFGRRRTFALRDDMSLDRENLDAFLEKYAGQPFLIFGFTFMVWQFFCLELERQGYHPDLSKGILIHGGGWKKLAAQAVSKEEFHRRLNDCCSLHQIHDYYGMAEQTGSIFMECECGHLHCSDYSAILFRRPEDFSLCREGERGIIQVLSVLPLSYPGHSLLTEDEGMLLGVDDCPCGRKGAYFQVFGRLKNAEVRGCSDTYGGA